MTEDGRSGGGLCDVAIYYRNLGDLRMRAPRYLSEPDESTLDQLGRRIQWVHGYVTHDRVYYVYQVPNEPFQPMPVE